MKKALITGINGSGATYLAEHLSTISDIQIQGISRWHTDRKIKSGVFSKIQMFECDLTDLGSVIRTLEVAQPDFIFHLAGVSRPAYKEEFLTSNVHLTSFLVDFLKTNHIRTINKRT